MKKPRDSWDGLRMTFGGYFAVTAVMVVLSVVGGLIGFGLSIAFPILRGDAGYVVGLFVILGLGMGYLKLTGFFAPPPPIEVNFRLNEPERYNGEGDKDVAALDGEQNEPRNPA